MILFIESQRRLHFLTGQKSLHRMISCIPAMLYSSVLSIREIEMASDIPSKPAKAQEVYHKNAQRSSSSSNIQRSILKTHYFAGHLIIQQITLPFGSTVHVSIVVVRHRKHTPYHFHQRWQTIPHLSKCTKKSELWRQPEKYKQSQRTSLSSIEIQKNQRDVTRKGIDVYSFCRKRGIEDIQQQTCSITQTLRKSWEQGYHAACIRKRLVICVSLKRDGSTGTCRIWAWSFVHMLQELQRDGWRVDDIRNVQAQAYFGRKKV